MEIGIKILTPLWTGGVETGKVDRIHETGILGSLRWWYETVVRGLGGKVCDPSKGECRFDAEKYANSKAANEQRLRDAGLCDVCQLFGATGWRRRFRLMIFDSTQPATSVSKRETADRTYTIGNQQKKPTWYFPKNQNDKPRSGNFTLHIQPLDPTFKPEIIAGLIQFIADWGAIGARPQMGFGVIKPANGQVETQPFYDHVVAIAGNATYPTLPSLRNMFFARISPKNGGTFSVQDTFNLKYDLRRLFANAQVRHFIMGTVTGQRIAAKVKMSRPYNNGQEMRVWGWIPIPEQSDVSRGNWNRDTIVRDIHDHLQQNYQLEAWREMNADRDRQTPNISDAKAFLRSLLGIQEEGDAA